MRKLVEIDEGKMKRNPFVLSLRIDATKMSDAGKFVPDSEGVMLPVQYLFEKERSAKIYYHPGAKDIIYKLSSGAKCLYLFLIYHLEPSCDYIRLNSEHYMALNGIKSIKTYRNAVRELCRYCFISESADYRGVYWINPMLFFSGNRITKYPHRVNVVNCFSK